MNQASFDLWKVPWVQLETASGRIERLGLEQTLRRAHEFRSIVEISPLCVVGLHRLLVAILQDALAPQRNSELEALWRAGRFPEEAIDRFGAEYGGRFDLFSAEAPFLQSAELPLVPCKDDKVKTVLYLHPDWPAHGEATHYRHGADEDAALCPGCAVGGLLVQPAFAASGGSGIKPSINGVPPIYVLPQGKTLFHSLAASLTTPRFQPEVADREEDLAWWRREPIIKPKAERLRVGYLHSLTFAVRQVRLHPEQCGGVNCSRCGAESDWLVRTMVYQMGESRQKEAPLWFDPFVAYRPRRSDSKMIALQPREGRAIWRDYGTLFLTSSGATGRPSKILAQFAEAMGHMGPTSDEVLSFRCIGMRTDGRAKVFEWIDQGLDVPLDLLHNEGAAMDVQVGLAFAEEVGGALRFVWRKSFGAAHDQNQALGQRMLAAYWGAQAQPFTHYALECAAARDSDAQADCLDSWVTRTVELGKSVFVAHSEQIGDDAASLRQRVQAEAFCRAMLRKKRKERGNE